MAEQAIVVGKVVPGHDQALAGLAPHVAEAVVAEVGEPGSNLQVNAAVGAVPAVSTQAHSCSIVLSLLLLSLLLYHYYYYYYYQYFIIVIIDTESRQTRKIW